jgi:tetratricopeptide (TPR) repeat protein
MPPPAATPPPTVTPPPAIPSPADNNYLEGLAMKQQGKYERALELFADAWKKEPGYPGVEENFPAALEGLKKSGDDAYEQGKLGEAGKRWAATIRYLSHPALKAGSPTISKAGLKGSIDKVSGILMEEGLADYRQGRLEEAIATWRQILAYDPSHEEAARSVKTATTQLKNLKKITPPAPGK